MAANYSVLSAGLYAIKFAEVLFRRKGTQHWNQFGDVDSFTLNIAPTGVARYRKNGAVRTKAIEATNQVDSNISFVCYQFTDFINAVSVLGEATPMVQTAVVDEAFVITAVQLGIYYVDKYDLTKLVMPEGFIEGTHYKIVDAALGGFEIFALPAAVELGSTVSCTFDAAAILETDGRVSAQVASKTEIEVELMVRQVGAVGDKNVLHLFDCRIKPEGDLSFIGDGDFSNVTISGSAIDTNSGVGILVDLKD